MNSSRYCINRKARRERVLRKMAAMRAAKERIRQERIDSGLLECEPKMTRYFPLEFGVRVKQTGETHFHDLTSVRHAAKALSLVLRYCA